MTPSRLSSHERAIVGGLLLLAFAVRLLFVLKLAPDTPFGDQDEYLDGARRLLAHQPLARLNLMFFIRAPGYSLFIALVWKLLGTVSMVGLRVAQAILGTVTCGYVFSLARLVDRRPWPAIVALAVAAVYPYHIFFAASPGTEMLFTFTIAAGMYHLARGLDDSPRLLHIFIGATILAFGNLVRPNLSTFLPLLGVWLLWRYWRRPRAICLSGALIGTVTLAITLPWIVSVHRQGFGWMWVTDGGSIWYYMGHNDYARRMYCDDHSPEESRALVNFASDPVFEDLPVFHRAASAPVTHQQAVFMQEALSWDRAHLGAQPCLAWHKLLGYWRPYVNPDGYSTIKVLISLFSAPVLAFGLVGLVATLRRRIRDALPWMTVLNILAGTLVAMMASTEIRYRIPVIDTLLIAFVGSGVSWLHERLGGRPVSAESAGPM